MPIQQQGEAKRTAFAPRRVNVVGTSAVGKSTLAATLARLLGVPHVELDALHWEPDWTEAPADLLRDRVRSAIAGDGWIVDGNYAAVRDLVWERVEAVVWLDLPLRTILSRYAVRTVRRVARREVLWSGNRERIETHLFSRDSLLWWILTTYRRRRREYPALLAGRPDLHVVRLRSARAADRWLAGLGRGGS
jgi:adenylate kinase family enzyme